MLLPDCLAALAAQQPVPDEILVVDDAPTDDGPSWVASHHPDVRCVANPERKGFVHTANAGLRAADPASELVILLNQDTQVQAGWLAALIEAARLPAAGIVGSRIEHMDGTLQHAGGAVDDHAFTDDLLHADLPRDSAPVTCEWVTGASLAITRAALQACGPLDEDFAPGYYEDVEWCARLRAKGFTVRYAPRSVVQHHAESRLRNDSATFMRLYHRNRLQFILKHWSPAALRDDFLPAEVAWLQSLSRGGERLIAVMNQLYIALLPSYQSLYGPRAEDEGSTHHAALYEVVRDLITLCATEIPDRYEKEREIVAQQHAAEQDGATLWAEQLADELSNRKAETRGLQQSLAEKQTLIEQYESGRFISAMRTVSKLRRALPRSGKKADG